MILIERREPGREFAFNRSGPGIGSYTFRYVMEPTSAGTRLTGSFDAERMEETTELLVGVFADLDTEIADGLTADDIYTNEFIDPSVSYDPSRYTVQSGS